MSTGDNRQQFCSPEDLAGIVCRAVRRRSGIGAEIRRYQIVARHIEAWDLSFTEDSDTPIFIEEWEQFIGAAVVAVTEEWPLTTYTAVKVTIQTEFPAVTEPWEITNQFFNFLRYTTDWEHDDAYTPVSIHEEDWEIPLVEAFVEEWEFAVTYTDIQKHAEDWEFTTTYVVDSLGTFTEEDWEFTTYLNFAKHADTWAPEIFFKDIVHEEDWDVTELLGEDSFGPIGFFTEENWDISEYAAEDSFGPLGAFTEEEWES